MMREIPPWYSFTEAGEMREMTVVSHSTILKSMTCNIHQNGTISS